MRVAAVTFPPPRLLLALPLLLLLFKALRPCAAIASDSTGVGGGGGGMGSAAAVAQSADDDVASSGISSSGGAADPSRCTPAPIEVPMCVNKHYNTTAKTIPGFSKQAEVAYVLKQFEELVRVPCAPFMRLFVCSMHLPLCASLLVRPCKEFCIRIRDLCSPVLLHFGHAWPPALACDGLLPERDETRPNLCLRPNEREFDEELVKLRSSDEFPGGVGADFKPRRQPLLSPPPPPPPESPEEPGHVSGSPTTPTTPAGADQRHGTQPHRLCTAAEVKLGHDPSGVACAQRCHASFLFSREDKAFASIWILIWSVICFVCSAMAVLTFALDSGRFLFPERPIVWIAGCYLLFSLGHILRAALGPEVACSQLDGPGTAPELYRVSRHAGHWCAVIFLLLYFSSLAGCLWWLVLTVCWYLCAARKWAHEALAHRTVWLHVFAWGVPLVLTVVLLVLHRIEADELTHLCVVDSSNRANLLIFCIAPFALSLLAGLCFLASALCSSVSVRHSLKWSGNDSFRRLEKLMTKISLFSFLFVLPTVCVLAAETYEFLERDKWTAGVEKLLARPACVNESGLLLNAAGGSCELDARPSSAFYMLKIFMSLAAGLPAGLVIWFNCKSLSAWHHCLSRLAARKKRRQHQLQQQQLWKLSTSASGQSGLPSAKSPAASGCSVGDCGGGGGGGRLMLLRSGQSKYPPINGIGTTEI